MDEELKNKQNNIDNAEEIQTPPPPPPVNATANISVSRDELEAYLKLTPPENGGAALSFAELKIALVKNGIMFGIDNGSLRNLADNPVYDGDTLVARGVNKKDGENAEIVYRVEMTREFIPKEKEDGSIDFKDLGLIQEVKKNAVLCEKIPATQGTCGTTVKGREIAPVPGKDKSMPMGKNTIYSDDKLKLLAALDGHVSVVSGKINILDIYVVPGDVSSQTGNINFSGNVIVKGDVMHGFSIESSGDVTINGVVESARIKAGGDLVIRGGFRGGELDAGANAACGFIENGDIKVRGNLDTSYIINSTVKCGGAVNLSGRGLIRGGSVTARESITANYIGANTSSAATVVEVGNDPGMVERFKVVSQEIEAQEKNIREMELIINSLLKLKEINRLTPDKAASLEKATAYVNNIRESYLELKEEHEKLNAQMTEIGYGKIHVKKTAYEGLKIVMGTDVLTLQTDHSFATFFRSSNGIEFTPFR